MHRVEQCQASNRHSTVDSGGQNISYLIRHAADGWNAPLEDPDIWEVKVHCNGDILSRPETISEEIIQQYPEAIAVEMEGEGVFAAAHDLNIEWILMKGIKDYANTSQSSSDKWGVFASVMAASVVANILSDPVVFQEWPHYNQAQPTEDVNEEEDLDHHYEEYDSWLEMANKDYSSFREMREKEQTDQQRRRINLFVARFQDFLPSTYVCDGCRVQLSRSGSRRYRCLHCVDVDLCCDCYKTGTKLKGHTENHELIEMRYKCSDCKQFILGTKFCCYKCPDFFLCIGCQSKHPVTHKVTKLPLEKDMSAGEESSNTCSGDPSNAKLAEPPVVKKCQEQLKSYYDTFNKVKIVPWEDCSAVHIDEIYIPLSWVRDDRTPSGVTQKKLKHYTDMFKGNKHHRKPTRMLVYGRPGIESTQKSGVSDQTNEQDINKTASCSTENTDSTTGPTPHCLSCVADIAIFEIERQEMETLVEVLPFVTSPGLIRIDGEYGEAKDAQLTESLVSRINFTNSLDALVLSNINLTASLAAVIARSLYQAPYLNRLDLSRNPLGEGVSVLSRHLSCVPDLTTLVLYDVKMTKEQANDLTKAVRQSNISTLRTEYHDDKGNLKPEDKWPTEEYWRRRWKVWNGSEDEQEPGSVTESDDEQEPGS